MLEPLKPLALIGPCLLGVCLLLPGCDTSDHSLTPEDAVSYINATPQACIIDLRTRHEYLSRHIPGAMNIPIRELPARLQEIPPDVPIVLYDSMGFRTIPGVRLLNRHYPERFVTSIRGYPYFSALKYTRVTSRMRDAQKLLLLLHEKKRNRNR